jgi:hypothetical protein
LKNEINQKIALEKDNKKINEYDESVNFYYDPLQYKTSNFSDLLADIKLNKKKKVFFFILLKKKMKFFFK